MAASEGGKEVVHIRAILQDFGYLQEGCTNIYEDNLSAVMCTNAVRRKYSRHIDFHRHHVREPVLAGGIKLVALGTHDMVADTFTKRLPAPALVRHRQVLNF